MMSNLVAVNRRNLETLRRSPAAEISGALGDLGTFIPLTLALALHGSIDLPATLVTSGLFNLVTGAVFGVPLPVQPMKAIVAATLATPNIPPSSPQMAGFLVGAALLVLSLAGLLITLTRHIPLSVIKGIQLGTGLSLLTSASPLLLPSPPITALAFLPLLCTVRAPRFPYALLAFLVSITVAVATLPSSERPALAPWLPWITAPFAVEFHPAVGMALAQLPLTTLNSIVAVTALSAELIPDVAPPGVTALGLSVALMNLSGPWLGAMPVCHGAGGLAGQWRFGARSGASVMVLGASKMVVGAVFGESLVGLLKGFPAGVLGVMLVAAAVELSRAGLVGLGEEGMAVALVTAAGMVATRNAAVGFAVGLLWHGAYTVRDTLDRSEGERRALLRSG